MIKRISNEFSFHTMYFETHYVLYIPSAEARGYKTHNSFHNTSYGMKIHLRSYMYNTMKTSRLLMKRDPDGAMLNLPFDWISLPSINHRIVGGGIPDELHFSSTTPPILAITTGLSFTIRAGTEKLVQLRNNKVFSNHILCSLTSLVCKRCPSLCQPSSKVE